MISIHKLKKLEKFEKSKNNDFDKMTSGTVTKATPGAEEALEPLTSMKMGESKQSTKILLKSQKQEISLIRSLEELKVLSQINTRLTQIKSQQEALYSLRVGQTENKKESKDN